MMVVPTRIIEKPEFDDLLKKSPSMGDTIVGYRLDAVFFDPPWLGEDGVAEPWTGERAIPINILLLNTVEPVIYKDTSGSVFIILNGFDVPNVFTYENFQDTHFKKNAWYYRLSYMDWDAKDWSHGLRRGVIVSCFNHDHEEVNDAT